MTKVQKVAVLTSGGDAPGMNAAIRSVVRAGLKHGLKMYVFYDGYKGLVEGRIEEADRNFVSDIINRGGTILHSARLPEFKQDFMQELAVKQLRDYDIDSLIVIGGDGTFRGAADLAKRGINTIGIPATIDNDIACTDYTIGFDTCLNTIIDCVDKIRDTTESHKRCTIIEVMGNKCGDLALFSGLAEGVEMVVSSDTPLPEEEIFAKLRSLKGGKKGHYLMIVSEKTFDNVYEFAKRVTENTGIECRAEVLGHIQRGGRPSARDRIEASMYGAQAIDALLAGKSSVVVAHRDSLSVEVDIMEAVNMKREPRSYLLDLIKLINR